MKIVRFLFLISIIVLVSCKNNKGKELKSDLEKISIVDTEVLKEDLILNGNQGVWYYKNQPFSGYAVRYHPNKTLMQKIGFYNGKKEGVAKIWFDNGILKVESHYDQNRLTGTYKSWWNNEVLSSESFYKDGKKQGVEKKWYASGVLAKKRSLIDGKENGMQMAWLANGKLYVNYEAKNGRIFGMRRANSCYKLEDEIIIRKK